MNCLIITVVVIIAVSTILWRLISLMQTIFLENKRVEILKFEIQVKKENEERNRIWKLEDEAKNNK